MSNYYALTITTRYGLGAIMTIHAGSRDDCANYIKKHVEKLFDPFFFKIVEEAKSAKASGMDDYQPCGNSDFFEFLKTLDEGDNFYNEYYVPRIRKFIKNMTTKEIFSIFDFHEETGNKEDGDMVLKKYKNHISL